MIPKQMYFYWGGSNLSWMRYMTLYSFRKMNPDWEMVLCIPIDKKKWDFKRKHDFSNYNGPDYLNKVSELDVTIEEAKFPTVFENEIKIITPIHESDLYRYYKLYNNGGFYSDTDILYFKSMDSVYDEINLNKSNTVLYQCSKYVAIGFLGAEKGNPFYKDLMLSAIGVHDYKSWEAYGETLIYNFLDIVSESKTACSNKIENKYDELKVYVIPKTLVYTYDWEEVRQLYDNPLIVPLFGQQAIGYHWYGGHPDAQKQNNNLNENNYMNYKTTFSEIAKRLL